MLTRHLASKLAPDITVNAIAPGPFESKMMAETLRNFGEQIAVLGPAQAHRAPRRHGGHRDLPRLEGRLVPDRRGDPGRRGHLDPLMLVVAGSFGVHEHDPGAHPEHLGRGPGDARSGRRTNGTRTPSRDVARRSPASRPSSATRTRPRRARPGWRFVGSGPGSAWPPTASTPTGCGCCAASCAGSNRPSATWPTPTSSMCWVETPGARRPRREGPRRPGGRAGPGALAGPSPVGGPARLGPLRADGA